VSAGLHSPKRQTASWNASTPQLSNRRRTGDFLRAASILHDDRLFAPSREVAGSNLATHRRGGGERSRRRISPNAKPARCTAVEVYPDSCRSGADTGRPCVRPPER
jgi:hypothetical protein